MIEIDGSEGEGGGQILRSALALSTLTGEPFRISGIRAKRDRPGLAAQHLTAVEGVRTLSDGKLTGARIGSTELTFEPGRLAGGRFGLDVGTAGSITLVLQACMLALARCENRVEIGLKGGTNVRWSPGIDYYQRVLFPLLMGMGANVEMTVLRRGFYPEGGGEISIAIDPWQRRKPFAVEQRGELQEIGGICFSRNLPEHVCQRTSDAVRKRFLELRPRIETDRDSGPSTGAGMQLWARYENTILGADSLGERGIPAEKLGDSAALALKQEIGSLATLDVHAADQLLPYMAISDSVSKFYVREISGHLSTQAELLRRFLGAEVVITEEKLGSLVVVRPTRT
ncbi:MAG TPA: RNA 3'-terminal phosphate cyclase [Methanomassiliicoccales archaeon]|jgi:RNA 3'-phosphate cyclase|nr:RNA 3'-terminal phosphate cyclase [Methanomassiliicoccales archaeon]